MRLSVIVPVYNEETTVKTIITALLKVAKVHEIIIVNDGSTDATKNILQNIKNKKVKIFHKKNEGKGSAIREGLQYVQGDYVLIQDADLEYHPDDIQYLTEAVEKRNVEVVYGSRFLGPHSNLFFWHLVGNKFLNFVVNILYDTTLSDMETCYKLIPTALFKQLDIESNTFDIEPEITCKILRRGIRIYEVPISYVGRDFSQGKKVTWKDGISAVKVILKWRFWPVSHL